MTKILGMPTFGDQLAPLNLADTRNRRKEEAMGTENIMSNLG
jgi:hypothetical protein